MPNILDDYLIAFFAVAHVAILYLINRGYWRSFRKDAPEKKFSYTIMDIWAATIGLTPTLLLAAYAINCHLQGKFDAGTWLVCAFLLCAGQLSGIFIMHLLTLRMERNLASGWESAGCILLGAIFGLYLAAAAGFAAAIILVLALGVVACLAGNPLVFCVLFLLIGMLLARRLRRHG